jgi:Cof subfamily protein (haloacid dehalogenase superfamily)
MTGARGAAGHDRVRLLALDLDGTLVGPDRVIRPRVRRAVAAAIGSGVIVTIATGRMYRSSLPFAQSLGIVAPIICYQGAYIRDLPAPDGTPGRLLLHRTLSGTVAREAIRWARQRGFDPHVNVDDRLVMEANAASAEDYERRSGIGAEFVPDLPSAIRGPVTKVLAVGTAPLPEESLPEARAVFHGRAQVTVSHPDYLEWNAPGVTKARAVRWLARRQGVPLAQAMAIGDQYNDAEMLAAVGHGVAMGGAPEAVRAAARHQTASFEDDGAALAIEALVLGSAAA